MTAFFIADLHLQPERPDITRALLDFLAGPALDAEQLYILGDLFEYWIGDDAINAFHQPILDALSQYSQSGRKLYYMHGNRDFAIGKRFAKLTGAKMLADPSKISLGQQHVLVMHGDLLCEGDLDYQRFRKIIRNPLLLGALRRLPRSMREKLASGLRSGSKEANRQKAEDIMDVTPAAVKRYMEQHQTALLIHGHTHRPNRHSIELSQGQGERIVLGDWDKKGWYLKLSQEEAELISFPIPAK